MSATVLVAGGGGFIGGHAVRALLEQGYRVRSVDIKPVDAWQQVFAEAENVVADLREIQACHAACAGVEHVYNFAADMGGMGFIETHKARCMLSVLINTHLLIAARDAGVARYFFASSACVYRADRQATTELADGLREEDAYPAQPEDGYGWEKLFSERMCRHFQEDFGLPCRIARYHNTYGPHGTWAGGREKAPAAICRKVIRAKLDGTNEIEIWGDGEQTRSFTYIDDCLEGTFKLMHSDVAEPLNIGSDQMVTINHLVDLVERIAGVHLKRTYNPNAPKGVRGRNSNNERIERLLRYKPTTPLEAGLQATYTWIENEIHAGRSPKA